jgi:Zn-dependent M28 family amino/carboxypeptidase
MRESPVIRNMRADVAYLASDELEGRATGSKGEELAAKYIAQQWESAGLTAAGSNNFYQQFNRRKDADPHATEAVDTSMIYAKNVIGLIDNGAPTTVVIGAHYDHLGWGESGESMHTGEPAIHNGADDNASGVAMITELARWIKQSGLKGNNYMFIAFSGEELGLWGSTYFMQNPTIADANINYMINLDMVGRLNNEKTLAVHGIGTSPVWKRNLKKANKDKINYLFSASGIGPSDHTQFYLKNIPVLHFFTGQHNDYHRPSDDAGKVNFHGMVTISSLIKRLIERLDNHGKIKFKKTKDKD